MKVWEKISNLGIKDNLSEADTKNVITANRIAFILAIMNFLILVASISFLGYTNSIPYLIIGEGFYLFNIILFAFGYHKFGRIFLSCYVTIAAFIYGIIIIAGREEFTPYIYYEIKTLMVAAIVLPLLIFSLRDKRMIFATLFINFLCLVTFDLALNSIGSGYFQNGGTDKGYNMAHYIFIQSQIFIMLSVLFLKSITAKYEKRNEDLIQELSHVNEELTSQNDQLIQLNREVEQRNEEISTQSEELNRANKKIQEQAELLQSENISLESEVQQKNEELTKTNVQLKKRNEELEQFSFAVSHNLRSPLTSLMGLVKLFKQDTENRNNIVDHIGSSVAALDDIVHGLGNVLALNKKEEHELQTINLANEINLIWELVKAENQEVRLEFQLNIESLNTIKPYLDSIFFNLLSNAIKYRSQERESYVRVVSETNKDNIILSIEDNGLGMDLKKHREDIFKMYKRFHEGITGNGIGLYLVKEQVELLGGSIFVESSPDIGTTFKIIIPNQQLQENPDLG